MQRTVVKNKSDGVLLKIGNGRYRIVISGKETQDKYAIIEMNVPPGAGPPPHSHSNVEELFYVAEGSVEFHSENGNHTSRAGDLIRIPTNGGIHTFNNTSSKRAILICTVYPAGFDEMFERINQTPQDAKNIGEQYGNEFFPVDYFTKN